MYEILIERRAERDLKRLSEELFRRIVRQIQQLEDDARPVGSRKIVGTTSDWRIRVGDYRVLYEIDDTAKAIRIMRVRHRRDAYR